MKWLFTHHSMAREPGRERVFGDGEAGRLRSDARITRDAPEGALFSFLPYATRPTRLPEPCGQPRPTASDRQSSTAGAGGTHA
jgi:hypothetical protein